MTEGTAASESGYRLADGTAPSEITVERQRLEGVTEPASVDWPPAAVSMKFRRPPPPPELRQFVRSMSLLGVPVSEIARRVAEKIKRRTYHTKLLYTDFGDDLLPRMKRGPRGTNRVRLIEKPAGWKPIINGAPFSYADLLAILQSDLDSRDLARLYGVKDDLVYRIRRGEHRYTKYVLPRMQIAQGKVTSEDMKFRAIVTADMAVKLVQQMRNMIEYTAALISRYGLDMEIEPQKPGPVGTVLYRKNAETGEVEERRVTSALERKAAEASGWKAAE